MKVDFTICGTQKGGTTALDAYLRQHPQVCMVKQKEVHFFDDEEAFAGGPPDYDRYHAAFKPQPSHRVIGEATPISMYWHDAPRRMWEYNPQTKHIVLLRNPIGRAYSHWNMTRTNGVESLSFGEAIRTEPQRCREALPHQHRVYSYVDRGCYLEQLRRLWRYFPQENVLVLKSESLRNDPLEALNDVCGFLGVDGVSSVTPAEVHSRSYAAPMGDRERDFLRAAFEYEIKGIERTLGWDCSNWLSS